MVQKFGNSRDILKITNLRVAIYNRCSTTKEAQNNALEVQVKESRRIAEELGWIITGHYVEQKTGTSTKHREEYKRMLGDLALDKFDVIMAKSQDRLMRDNKEWYELIELLTRYKKQLYLYLDNMVYDCDDNGFILGIMMQLHAQYSRNLSIKIREAHEIRQREKSGLNITSVMFGWDKIDKDKYIINEEEAYYYRKGFELLRSGMGYRSIASKMYNDFGVVSKKTGKMISQTQWRKMLTSTRAYGTVILRKYTKPFGTEKRNAVPKEEQIIVENALPAIVSKEYFEDTMRMVENRNLGYNFVKEKNDFSRCGSYPLSNKVFCGQCGQAYYRTKTRLGKSDRIVWKCSNAMNNGTKNCNCIPADENTLMRMVEKRCDKYFNGIFPDDTYIIKDALAYIRRVLKDKDCEKQIEKLKDKLNMQNRKKLVLINKLTEEVISDCDFKTQNERLTSEISGIQEEIGRLSNNAKEMAGYKERIDMIGEKLVGSVIVNRAKTFIYLKMINKIVVYKDKSAVIRLNPYKIKDFFGFFDIDEDSYEIKTEYQYEPLYLINRNVTKLDILDLYRENDRYMYTDLIEKLGCTYSYIYRCVKELKEEGRLTCTRLGNERAVKWTVLEDKEVSDEIRKYYRY